MPLPMIGCIRRGSLQCGHMISGVVLRGFPLRSTRPFSYFAADVSATGIAGWLVAPAFCEAGSRVARAIDSACVAADCMRRSFSERWHDSAVLRTIFDSVSSRISWIYSAHVLSNEQLRAWGDISLPGLPQCLQAGPTQTRLRPQTCCWVAMAMLAVQQAVQGVAGYVDGMVEHFRRGSFKEPLSRAVRASSLHWNPTHPLPQPPCTCVLLFCLVAYSWSR